MSSIYCLYPYVKDRKQEICVYFLRTFKWAVTKDLIFLFSVYTYHPNSTSLGGKVSNTVRFSVTQFTSFPLTNHHNIVLIFALIF